MSKKELIRQAAEKLKDLIKENCEESEERGEALYRVSEAVYYSERCLSK